MKTVNATSKRRVPISLPIAGMKTKEEWKAEEVLYVVNIEHIVTYFEDTDQSIMNLN